MEDRNGIYWRLEIRFEISTMNTRCTSFPSDILSTDDLHDDHRGVTGDSRLPSIESQILRIAVQLEGPLLMDATSDLNK
ncbi:hypothetical protein KM043_002351 [Ampulex compressa]|nr:hypothetical protein KM043_002351 [Ampulex compressa]